MPQALLLPELGGPINRTLWTKYDDSLRDRGGFKMKYNQIFGAFRRIIEVRRVNISREINGRRDKGRGKNDSKINLDIEACQML